MGFVCFIRFGIHLGEVDKPGSSGMEYWPEVPDYHPWTISFIYRKSCFVIEHLDNSYRDISPQFSDQELYQHVLKSIYNYRWWPSSMRNNDDNCGGDNNFNMPYSCATITPSELCTLFIPHSDKRGHTHHALLTNFDFALHANIPNHRSPVLCTAIQESGAPLALLKHTGWGAPRASTHFRFPFMIVQQVCC